LLPLVFACSTSTNLSILSERKQRTLQGLDEVADAEFDAMLMFAHIEWEPRGAS
jgi:hypothetical protein